MPRQRLHIGRWNGVDITVRAFGRYWCIAWAKHGLFHNGRRWIVMRPARCLCAWYGPDLWDGCSDCA